MKIGDKVRFLSEMGGGKVAGFQGKDIVLVEDEDRATTTTLAMLSQQRCSKLKASSRL